MASLDDQIKLLIVRLGTQFKTVQATIAALPAINDAAASVSSLYSSSKIEGRISAAMLQVKNDLTNGAGSALDTLKELADALGNDPNFATNIANSLAKRVRVDAVQTFTDPEKAQARSNIDVWGKSEIGPVNSDYVAAFEAAIAP